MQLVKAGDKEAMKDYVFPTLETNNVQLSGQVKMSEATIWRHLSKLKGGGFITAKILHGPVKNYELKLNIDILQAKPHLNQQIEDGEAKRRADESKKVASTDSNLDEIANLKPSDTRTTRTDNINNNSDDVNKGISSADVNDHNTDEAGHTREIEKVGEPHQELDSEKTSQVSAIPADEKEKISAPVPVENSEGSKEKEVIDKKPVDDHSRGNAFEQWNYALPDEVHGVSIKEYLSDIPKLVQLLWSLSVKYFWEDAPLTDKAIYYAKLELEQWYRHAVSVFIRSKYFKGNNPKLIEKFLQDYHEELCARLTLAKKYIDKNPSKRYVQLPHLYFDHRNKNGFSGTRKWYIETKHKQRENSLNLLVAQCLVSLKNNLDLKTYQQMIAKIKPYGEKWVEKFNEKAQDQELLNNLNH